MARVPSNEPTEGVSYISLSINYIFTLTTFCGSGCYSTELEHPFSKDSPLCLDGQIRPLSDHIVAGGGHSDIYMGELQLAGGQKQTVAIKVIRAFNWQKNSKVVQKLIRVSLFSCIISFHVLDCSDIRQRTWREFAAWSTLSHPNIMEFIGYSFDFVSGPAPGLVSPWMKNGTLYSYLEENPTVERFPLVRHSPWVITVILI